MERLNSCARGTVPVQDLRILAVAFRVKELDLRVEQTEPKPADITDVFAQSARNGLVDLKLGHQILLKENDRPLGAVAFCKNELLRNIAQQREIRLIH